MQQYKRGEIVYVTFHFEESGEKKEKPHPAIILSTTRLHSDQEIYLVAMLSTIKDERTDLWSYILEKKHFLKKATGNYSHIRLHLVRYVQSSHINRYKGGKVIVKDGYVDDIINQINTKVFGLKQFEK